MVEENFKFAVLKYSRMKDFKNDFLTLFSPWLKKILNFATRKYSKMKDIKDNFSNYFHNGWRKFWNLWFWVAPE